MTATIVDDETAFVADGDRYVLRIQDGAIAEITTFGPELFPAFDLPPTL